MCLKSASVNHSNPKDKQQMILLLSFIIYVGVIKSQEAKSVYSLGAFNLFFKLLLLITNAQLNWSTEIKINK